MQLLVCIKYKYFISLSQFFGACNICILRVLAQCMGMTLNNIRYTLVRAICLFLSYISKMWVALLFLIIFICCFSPEIYLLLVFHVAKLYSIQFYVKSLFSTNIPKPNRRTFLSREIVGGVISLCKQL